MFKAYGINTGYLRDKYGIHAEEIIIQIDLDPEITVEELAKVVGKSQSTIEKTIKKLRDDNMLKRVGSRKTGRWVINPK
ncbi:MAG TPA: helix-turn-helix domain-containing protein [Nitrososphaera sp.]|nr:helix-turn-helix domain-containing protein [Nitrososphaera sp.]